MDSKCPRCGASLKTVSRPHMVPVLNGEGEKIGSKWGEPVMMLDTCECVKRERRAADEKARAEERQAYIDSIIKNGNLEARFASASFDTWPHTLETEKVYGAAYECAEAIIRGERDSGLILLGSVGNGKSTLAAAICKHVAARYRTFHFANVPQLLDLMRNTFDEDSKERLGSIMHALRECDLLVLDDLGAERCTEWAEERLYLVINERYTKQRNIVVTTNAERMKCRPDDAPTVKAFADMVGERIYDRLIEMCAWIENDAGSFRKVAARERMARG